MKEKKSRRLTAILILLMLSMVLLAASCGQPAGVLPPQEEKSVGELQAAVHTETPDTTGDTATMGESAPAPAASSAETPIDVQPGDQAFTCTISISCKTIIDNIGAFPRDKADLVPDDGMLFAAREVVFYAGENVFQVLRREMKQARMHMEFMRTPLHDSVYLEGIGNIYEFDCGALSGWMYKVNEVFPSYSSGQYLLADGDVVEWMYTCDLGRDIGGEGGFWAGGES